METAMRLPLRERVNLRLVFFIGVMALLVGYPLYVALDTQLSGGIKDAGDYKLVNLKAMSTFEFDQVNGTVNDVPKPYRELDGKKVILRGEMWEPLGTGNEVEKFDLVYSIAKCCVTSTPQVQHFVHSRVMPGKTAELYSGPVEVRGVLHVNVKKEADRVSSVYQLDVESVSPAS